MALMQWSQMFSVGVTQFDNEHKKLVDLLNNLHDAMKAGKGNDVIGKTLDGLISYTATHFASEEKLMQQHNYPAFAKHKTEHISLTNQALQIQKDFHAGKALPSNLLQFLKDWLLKHIGNEDKLYGPFLNSKGIK